MKIIFSRKGFDASNGGVPSPIFSDGSMVSMPIPSRDDAHCMGDLNFSGVNLGELADQLTRKVESSSSCVHLDPDIQDSLIARPIGWRPAFGQTGAAQTHLSNCKVGVGDVFLFFGWFRRVEHVSGRYKFVRDAPDQHVIYGWLQVDEIWNIVSRREELLAQHPGQRAHPHLATPGKYTNPRNTLYIARNSLVLSENSSGLAGAGVFSKVDDRLVLTKEGRTRRYWKLPRWFYPNDRFALSYHSSKSAWTLHDDHVELRSAAIGQEFVLDTNQFPEGIGWLNRLLTGA